METLPARHVSANVIWHDKYMNVKTFDKIEVVAIIVSIAFTFIVALLSWDWFPTPGDWGDIAHIPKSMKNYMALLLPPTTILACLLIRRCYFKKEF